jgi:hypothetical protein
MKKSEADLLLSYIYDLSTNAGSENTMEAILKKLAIGLMGLTGVVVGLVDKEEQDGKEEDEEV